MDRGESRTKEAKTVGNSKGDEAKSVVKNVKTVVEPRLEDEEKRLFQEDKEKGNEQSQDSQGTGSRIQTPWWASRDHISEFSLPLDFLLDKTRERVSRTRSSPRVSTWIIHGPLLHNYVRETAGKDREWVRNS